MRRLLAALLSFIGAVALTYGYMVVRAAHQAEESLAAEEV